MALTDPTNLSAHMIIQGALFALERGYRQQTLTGALTLTNQYPSIVGLDPNGATRVITLDGVATAANDQSIRSLTRLIINRAGAAENLTINDAQTVPVTIATLNQNEAGLFYHDGATGWALVCIFTIALS